MDNLAERKQRGKKVKDSVKKLGQNAIDYCCDYIANPNNIEEIIAKGKEIAKQVAVAITPLVKKAIEQAADNSGEEINS